MATRRYTEEQFRSAIEDPDVRSLADLCRALGIVPRGANYGSVRRYAAGLGLDVDGMLASRRSDGSRAMPQPIGSGRRRNIPSYDDQDLLRALEDPTIDSYASLCLALGLRPLSNTYRRLREHASRLGRDLPPSWSRTGPKRNEGPLGLPARGSLVAAVNDALSLAETIRRLGHEPSYTTYQWVRAAIAEYDIDTSHFRPYSRANGRKPIPLDQVLVRGRATHSGKLRERLIDAGLKERRCEVCRRTEWNGRPIPLELDHIDGDRLNNLLENLRLLCPNCHAQTPTYRGRNIGRSRASGKGLPAPGENRAAVTGSVGA